MSSHMVLSGGLSREEQVKPLSNLFPHWRLKNEGGDDSELVHCSLFLSWFNSHLCVNDIVYPSLSLQTRTHTNMTALLNDSPPESGASSEGAGSSLPVSPPMRVLESLSTLSAARPTVVVDFHLSTYLHIVSSGPTLRKQASVSKHDSSSAMSVGSDQATTPTDTSDCMSEGGMLTDSDNDNCTVNAVTAERESSDADTERESNEPSSTTAHNDLPHLVVKGCTRSCLYFISPFASATILDCHDCDIIIGPVASISVINNCVKCRISVISRKVLVKSCSDCILSIATLSPTVISGDSHSIRFGPYNTCYRHLKLHMNLADLSILHSKEANTVDYWTTFYDVKTLLELPVGMSSPTGYAADATKKDAAEMLHSDLLPAPQERVAMLLSPLHFKFVSVPYRAEFNDYQSSCIPIPPQYLNQLNSTNDYIASVRSSLAITLLKSGNVQGSAGDSDIYDMSSYLSGKFTEWLVKTNKIQQILDLIRIDVEASEKVSVKH